MFTKHILNRFSVREYANKNIVYSAEFNTVTFKWDLKCVKHRFISISSVNDICGFDSKLEAEVYADLIGE